MVIRSESLLELFNCLSMHFFVDCSDDLDERTRETEAMGEVGGDDEDEKGGEVERVRDDGHELVESERDEGEMDHERRRKRRKVSDDAETRER